MAPELFRLINPPRPVTELGCWAKVTGRFSLVAGYTAFGVFFLLDPDTQQYAVLYTIGPKLLPTNFRGKCKGVTTRNDPLCDLIDLLTQQAKQNIALRGRAAAE